MLALKQTAKFKKDYKLAKRRGKDLAKLAAIIDQICSEKPLPRECSDHELVGNYKGHRECHVEPDWLLIYRIDHGEMICTAVRTGSHSDLLGL